MIFKIGGKVQHEKYGVGTVLDAWKSRRGGENYAIQFKKGGPMGWAENSTNDVADLKAV